MTTCFEAIQTALAPLPYPARQAPADEGEATYLSYFLVVATPMRASGGIRRMRCVMQVDIWSMRAIVEELTYVRRALEDAGIRIQSWGPAAYEDDTGRHHMPVTCVVTERLEDDD